MSRGPRTLRCPGHSRRFASETSGGGSRAADYFLRVEGVAGGTRPWPDMSFSAAGPSEVVAPTELRNPSRLSPKGIGYWAPEGDGVPSGHRSAGRGWLEPISFWFQTREKIYADVDGPISERNVRKSA